MLFYMNKIFFLWKCVCVCVYIYIYIFEGKKSSSFQVCNRAKLVFFLELHKYREKLKERVLIQPQCEDSFRMGFFDGAQRNGFYGVGMLVKFEKR